MFFSAVKRSRQGLTLSSGWFVEFDIAMQFKNIRLAGRTDIDWDANSGVGVQQDVVTAWNDIHTKRAEAMSGVSLDAC
jgi:hypothetical protein